jgi:hypothetical protein
MNQMTGWVALKNKVQVYASAHLKERSIVEFEYVLASTVFDTFPLNKG